MQRCPLDVLELRITPLSTDLHGTFGSGYLCSWIRIYEMEDENEAIGGGTKLS